MRLFEKLNNKITKKAIVGVLISIVLLYISVYIYSLIFEQDKLAIDRYNFGQLVKVKFILKDIPKEKMNFYTLGQFNETYNSNIKPIKNCYVLSYRNGNKPYLFGFQLESLIYRFIYFGKNYAYPSYSRPKERYCFGEYSNGARGGCYESDKQPFIDRISNPCQD